MIEIRKSPKQKAIEDDKVFYYAIEHDEDKNEILLGQEDTIAELKKTCKITGKYKLVDDLTRKEIKE